MNLPGSKKAVEEGFEILKEILPHAVAVIKNNQQKVSEVHQDF